ncbi:MAG: DegV family protein [Chloroflexi bacterium]|nr:DegV family protein [Chloroflexota bacterium]
MLKIVTDSSSSLPASLAKQHDITIVPQYVLFGQKLYRDEIDLSPSQFYTMLRESNLHPSTTQPSPGDFRQAYQPLVEAGHEIISLHIPSSLSGTYNSAMTALKDMADGGTIAPPIHVIDTAWTSLALGMMALEAARLAQANKSAPEILRQMKKMDEKLHIFFVVDTLEYLQRGGRIGGAQAILGTLLKIKPILALEHGRVEAKERIRTKAAALQRMNEMVGERVSPGDRLHVGVLHAQAPEEAAQTEKYIRQRFNCVEVLTNELGPVIGAHAGPGTIGIAFYTE